MDVTWHWVQAVGARAVAVLADKPSPTDVTVVDLDQVVERIAADATKAAAAEKREPGWAWWCALAACFPNSPATHPSRTRRSEPEIHGLIEALFAPDGPDGRWSCWCCETPTSTRWGKSLWPLAAPASHLNTVQGRQPGGVAVCRACRVCAWALPYGSLHDGSTVTTVDPEDLRVGMEAAELVVAHNLTVIDERADRWPHPRVPARLAEILQGVECHVHAWRNDNREARLETIFQPVGQGLSVVEGQEDARASTVS